jgi:hypothetical protein
MLNSQKKLVEGREIQKILLLTATYRIGHISTASVDFSLIDVLVPPLQKFSWRQYMYCKQFLCLNSDAVSILSSLID